MTTTEGTDMSEDLRDELAGEIQTWLADPEQFVEHLADTLTKRFNEWHHARVSDFAQATDEAAKHYEEKAKEAKATNVGSYREGKADGLALAAQRARRMTN